jgi:hypothetical protein
MNQERLNRITVEEGKCGGRHCIRGQRLRVTDVLELLASGASFDEILKDYPSSIARTSWLPLTTPRTRPITLSFRLREVSANERIIVTKDEDFLYLASEPKATFQLLGFGSAIAAPLPCLKRSNGSGRSWKHR